ncbi:MAG: TonB-dependent receptor domain-containing protein, partial [Flavobacteriales bacterium]
ILIDGKPSGLTGISSTDALRQLQGDMVEKIEVITNPSARYDAEGEAGIINIILKKEQQKGVNGSFTLQAGEPVNHSVSLNMNSRRKHFNIFTSGSVRYRQSPGGGNSNTIFRYADTTYRYTEQRDHIRGGWSGNLQLGTDLYLSDKNTLTLAGRYNLSDNDNNATLLYRDYNEDDVLTQTVNRTEEETSTRENQSLRMNYRKEFMQEDRLFTLDASWEQSADDEYADLYETSDDTSVDPLTQRTSNLQAESRWHFQTDYVHPFGPEGKFETGAKASLRDLDNDYGLEQQQSDASWQVIPDFDNHLRYIENIYAAYVMAGNKTGKFSYQGGLRIEYSDITTELIQTRELNHRTYLDLFPSAHFSYELKKNNFLQLSYSRRIRRPRFWYLLPFFGFSDSRSIWSGNPNLDPEFTHSLETGYLRQWDNGSLLSSVYYRHTDGVIERISFSDSVGFTQRFPVNLATRDAYGLELSGSWQPFRWWSINGSGNFYRSITDGQYEQQDFFSDTYAWTGRLSSKWTVKRKFSCQTSVKYRSARETAQGKRYPSYNWDAGFAVDMLKGNGTLSFSARDILNTRKHRSVTYESTFTSESEFQWHTRQFTLSFNYRINQKKKRSRWNGGEMEGEGFEMEM